MLTANTCVEQAKNRPGSAITLRPWQSANRLATDDLIAVTIYTELRMYIMELCTYNRFIMNYMHKNIQMISYTYVVTVTYLTK